MLLTVLFVLTTGIGPPGEGEYNGPAYTSRDDTPRSVAGLIQGEALILCVRAGGSPKTVEGVFGSADVVSQDGKGPVVWWYPHLGVTVYFPPRVFRFAGPVERIRGGVIP